MDQRHLKSLESGTIGLRLPQKNFLFCGLLMAVSQKKSFKLLNRFVQRQILPTP